MFRPLEWRRPQQLSIAAEGAGLPAQGLHVEVAHYPVVTRQHVEAVGIEGLHYLDLQTCICRFLKYKISAIVPVLIGEAAQSDCVHTAPVALELGMYLRIAVNLTGGESGRDGEASTVHAERADEHSDAGQDRECCQQRIDLHSLLPLRHQARQPGEGSRLVSAPDSHFQLLQLGPELLRGE